MKFYCYFICLQQKTAYGPHSPF